MQALSKGAQNANIVQNHLIGLTLEQATEYATPLEVVIRCVKKDGYNIITTRDYRTNRVNVSITDGKIVRVVNIG